MYIFVLVDSVLHLYKVDTWNSEKLVKKKIFFFNAPGAQRDKDESEDDEGHGAAMLSVKSHVKLKPVELSNMTSAGKLRSKQPAQMISNQVHQHRKSINIYGKEKKIIN